ncbi:head-tail adaptor protein [Myroides odoratimimus]|uniref:phage head completion protein n=1 Tax=Myroides odoratimimus TaxID=76832 RepID=UPI0038D404D4
MDLVRKPYIGQMDSRISVYEVSKKQNNIGEEKESKELVTKCWAKIDQDIGSEDVKGNVRHLMNKKFTIRWNRKILEKSNQLIVEYSGIEYSVTHVSEIGRKSHLQLICFSYV